MDRVRRWLAGRNGMDQLNIALICLWLILYLLYWATDLLLFWLLSLACLVFTTYRMLSGRLDRRWAENERFLNFLRPIRRKINVTRSRFKDKDHCYFKCPSCGQQLRAPKGKGKIRITCRSCGATFEKKT